MMHDAGTPLIEKTKVFLKHQLKQNGLTRAEFAEQFHCDERTVRRWESKGINSLETVEQMIVFFHASVRDVFPVGEDVPDPFLYAPDRSCPFLYCKSVLS